jgi:hypothetical protein
VGQRNGGGSRLGRALNDGNCAVGGKAVTSFHSTEHRNRWFGAWSCGCGPRRLAGSWRGRSELIFLLAAAVAELTGFGCGGIADLETPGCLIHSGPKLAEQWRRGCLALRFDDYWRRGRGLSAGYEAVSRNSCHCDRSHDRRYRDGLFQAGVAATGLATLLAAVIAPAAATERPELVSRGAVA